ncbi:uncharacterized protein DUF4163 [Chitinophaga skermanii]|uniref:Uncharacterized protein DUF4163 n=1 Tax=Chitinophaga skermanii TaxID=331697 RepID=A0A327Q089_9BACT|nr:DUF3298 and DUF4163 domain-containing protein [Chitinophaga skermanii]RAI97463.1 uncharacterized protein DUF4163 [Chitinophaga skermanii]
MQKQWLIIACSVALFACNSKTKNTGADSTEAAITSVALVKDPFFTKQLKGTVADQAITMQILKSSDKTFSGYYSYDKIKEPIKLWGGVDSAGNILLHEELIDDVDQYFKGKLTDEGTYEGTWIGPNKSYPFKLKVVNEEKVISFLVTHIEDSAKLIDNMANSPVGTVRATVLWPVAGADDATLTWLRNAITQFDTKRDFPNAAAYAKNYTDSFVTHYRGENDTTGFAEIAAEGGGMSYNWDEDNTTEVAWNKYPLLALERYFYAYTGGAHGNYGSAYQMFDLSKKKELKVADVFKPGFQPALSAALEKSLRKRYKLTPDQPLKDNLLFDNKIEPNENFFITDAGVTFSYTPYEIAPYVVGQIYLFVPFSEIKDWVQPEYLPKQ